MNPTESDPAFKPVSWGRLQLATIILCGIALVVILFGVLGLAICILIDVSHDPLRAASSPAEATVARIYEVRHRLSLVYLVDRRLPKNLGPILNPEFMAPDFSKDSFNAPFTIQQLPQPNGDIIVFISSRQHIHGAFKLRRQAETENDVSPWVDDPLRQVKILSWFWRQSAG